MLKKSFKIQILLLFFVLCFVSASFAQEDISFQTSPYSIKSIEAFDSALLEKYSCPVKPAFLLISKKEWCRIHQATHNAVINQGLSNTLGYSKSMAVMLGLIHKESSFKANAMGRAGEVGLAQIMPSTGRFICNSTSEKLKDINANLNCAAKYLNLLLSKDYFDKDLEASLMAYNQGWGNVKKGIYYDEDIRYVKLILTEYSPRFLGEAKI